MQPTDEEAEKQNRQAGGPYAWYVLGLLMLVYVVNFVDRQILSILAEDIKADLGIDDAQMGFLYGTVFGVFFALFGIPLGRLADNWHRIRLLSYGMTLWSTMTVLSGLSKGYPQLALARIGVGVGEATASPVAYSVLSDYFPREKRATALSIYSAGLYLGSGLSLFIGGYISNSWNVAFPEGGPLGIVGWQATFMIVGFPGLLIALWVASLREPIRGLSDGLPSAPIANPWRPFFTELVSVLPPFTFIHLGRFGAQALILNLAVAFGVTAAGIGLYTWLGNAPQWLALGLGVYSAVSWAQSLYHRDRPTYRLIWGSATFTSAAFAFGFISLIGYSVIFWSAPYALRTFDVSVATVGFYTGGGGALGGFLGVILGGRLGDRLKLNNPAGRIWVPLITALAMGPLIWIQFKTTSSTTFFICYFFQQMAGALYLGVAAATILDLVLPRMRGAATAAFTLSITLIGLGIGPFAVGRLSDALGSLAPAILSLLILLPLIASLLIYVYTTLPTAEANRLKWARAAGEPE